MELSSDPGCDPGPMTVAKYSDVLIYTMAIIIPTSNCGFEELHDVICAYS